jgi:predicted MFS family arabinose efflux permease
MFFGNGFVMASSFSRMPGIRDQVGATPTQLAFALVCVGIGSILGMPFTDQLVNRYSSRTVSRAATNICLGGWAILPMADSVPMLALMLLATGVGTGIGDVAMNVQGHLVEQRPRRATINRERGFLLSEYSPYGVSFRDNSQRFASYEEN